MTGFSSALLLAAAVFQPNIPRTWEDASVATLEVPLANPKFSPIHISEAEYYRLPERTIYRSYPVYHPDREPAGYMEWLKGREPEIAFDPVGLKTRSDFIAAGEIVFNAPTIYNELFFGAGDLRDRSFYKNGGMPVATDGTVPFARWVIRRKGQVELGSMGCNTCHTRVLHDGTVVPGAQGNNPGDRQHAEGVLGDPRLSSGRWRRRSRQTASRQPGAHASRTVGAVPSMIWAGLYLLCIPGFACLYTWFPSDAWQYSTIMNERRHRDTMERFEQDTARWLERTSGPMLLSAMQQTGFNRPDRITYFVRYDPKLNPTMEALVEYDKPRSFATLWFSLENAQVSSVPFVFSNSYRLQALCEDDKKSCIATRVYEAFGTANSFKVTDDIKTRFQQLRDEDEGRSTGRTLNTFIRTLYLSAVTITTVGYGDIVPLTDAARAAVASEAITGIMLIGLFLNALAYERDNASEDRNPDQPT